MADNATTNSCTMQENISEIADGMEALYNRMSALEGQMSSGTEVLENQMSTLADRMTYLLEKQEKMNETMNTTYDAVMKVMTAHSSRDAFASFYTGRAKSAPPNFQ